ncbi:hypothetical protein D3C84_866390 [compost metagenome]
MRSMALTVSSTRSRPSPAERVASFDASEVLTALRATSSTALVISVTAVAACSISLFCCCRPRALSSVTLFNSSAAEASCVAEPAISCRVSRSLFCILAMARSSRAASSWPLVSMVRVRSPSAMRSAACRASSIGLTMLRVSSRAQIRVSTVAANSRLMTRLMALEY